MSNKYQNEILDERERSWGPPMETHDRIAMGWTGLLKDKLKPGETLTGYEVAMMMVYLKLVRGVINPDDPDSLIDGNGYLEIAGLWQKDENEESIVKDPADFPIPESQNHHLKAVYNIELDTELAIEDVYDFVYQKLYGQDILEVEFIPDVSKRIGRIVVTYDKVIPFYIYPETRTLMDCLVCRKVDAQDVDRTDDRTEYPLTDDVLEDIFQALDSGAQCFMIVDNACAEYYEHVDFGNYGDYLSQSRLFLAIYSLIINPGMAPEGTVEITKEDLSWIQKTSLKGQYEAFLLTDN